jgi:hypothetical protein
VKWAGGAIFFFAVIGTVGAMAFVPWNRRWSTNTFRTSWAQATTQPRSAEGQPAGPYQDRIWGWRWSAPPVAVREWTDDFPGGHDVIKTVPTNQESSIDTSLVAMQVGGVWLIAAAVFIYLYLAGD